jgi:hypothetical protein
MRFLRPVSGYILIDHRCNEDIREELQILDMIKTCGLVIKVATITRENGTKQIS